MRSVSVMLIATWVVAGCATVMITYDKTGVTEAERQRDRAECAQISITGGGVRRGFALFRIDRDVYQQCMGNRGYTSRAAT
jgi:uncharacterized protein YceK